jgi:hypothetical protein
MKPNEYPSPEALLVYLENTSEDSWLVNRCRVTEAGVTRNCLRGHLLDFGGLGYEDIFHECIATEYMYYAVNDGTDPRYPQTTPKQRCIAYLQDLLSGKEKTTAALMEEDYQFYLQNQD